MFRKFVAQTGMFILGLGLVLSSGATNDDLSSPAKHETQEVSQEMEALPFTYRPPQFRGAPKRRIGGSTRGDGIEPLWMSVLAPEYAGYTMQAQPDLYWFVSREVKRPVEILISAKDLIDPVLEVRLERGVRAGINHISLSAHGVELEVGKKYRWSVVVTADPLQRSRDWVTSGGLQRMEPSAELAARLSSASAEEKPRLYAENGLWYDSLGELSRLVAERPSETAWRQQRAALLRQIGLDTAAVVEREG